MRFGSVLALTSCMMVAAVAPASAMPRAHRGPTSPKLFNSNAPKHSPAASRPALKPVSQRAIEPARATQIQSALIKNGYMTGSATGVWDAQTETAMQKMQSDNGWQTKIVPDARAIIKLGLGPNASSAEGPTESTESEAASKPAIGPQ